MSVPRYEVIQVAETLAERLKFGDGYINRREWDRTVAKKHVQDTVRLFPTETAAWVQAFTLFSLTREGLLALFYFAGAVRFELTTEQLATLYRDMALMLLRTRQYDLCQNALDMAQPFHAGVGDPNREAVYKVCAARLAMRQRNFPLAASLLSGAEAAYDQAALSYALNDQWRFNLRMARLRLANAQRDWNEARLLRAQLQQDVGRYTPTHRIIAHVLRVPGAWRLFP